MKITLRLIISLFIASTLVAVLFTMLQIRNERTTMVRELNMRAHMLTEGIQNPIAEYLRSNSTRKMKQLLDRFAKNTRYVGIAVYDSQAVLCMATAFADSIGKQLTITGQVWESLTRRERMLKIVSGDVNKVHIFILPLELDDQIVGAIVLYQDASFIDARVNEIWQTNFLRLLLNTLLIVITTVIVVRWSITGPIAQLAQWIRGLRVGKPSVPTTIPMRGDFLEPLTNEVTLLAKSLATARAAAQAEARLRITAEARWTPERLKEFVRMELKGKNLYVVSNREPYMHVVSDNTVQCIVPAGGLVTAIDPILRACGGVWIASGSGVADRENADEHGRLEVPPDEPAYILHRIFLTKEEEEGYYYGFSNEGLWPLCHITHTRPIFELNDWMHYQQVNQKFAEAVFEEIANEEQPLVLIQDYHFALLPLLIKSKRPDARVAIFWHIPWPNPEVFGICPWKQELLLGLLGADLIGFHTQFHCNNFLETVDRFLESKINWDQFSVDHKGQRTVIRPFPISVAEPEKSLQGHEYLYGESAKKTLLKRYGINAQYLGVGVDRIDYTKGILERFRAIERFLEKYPSYIGSFTFIELGAPSRTHIKRYHDLMAELDELADRINWKFQTKQWKPILFLKAHHTHEVIYEHYRAADVCMVTSLHDGMNLVAKEFIASREDGDGVLLLSQFTGASQELTDALIINPYDIEEMADALYTALTMDPKERRERMSQLRNIVSERNVYRWAGNIITTLSRLRVQEQKVAEGEVA